MVISIEKIRKPDSVSVRKYQFPEDFPGEFAGEEFFVRVMNAKERSRYEMQFSGKNGIPVRSRVAETRERLVVATLCNENGVLMLNDSAIDTLGEMDGQVVGFMAVCAMEANRVESDLEQLAKN